MYEINIDNEGYYAEGNEGTMVEVTKMPIVDDVRHLQAYKYDAEAKRLVLDEDKLDTIKAQIDSETVDATPTIEERLEAIEGLMLAVLSEGGE